MSSNDLLRFSASVEIQAGDGGKRPRLAGLAYSGGVMAVGGWGQVAIDLDGLSIPSVVPVLADHADTLSGVVGSARPERRAGQLHIQGELAATAPAGQAVLALARDNVPLQLSVGVHPTRTVRVAEKKSVQLNGQSLTAPAGGLVVVQAGDLREVSVVVLGADANTYAAVAARHRGAAMNETNEPATPETPDPVQAERERVGRINAACVGRWDQDQRVKVEELRGKAVAGELSVEALQADLLSLIRGSRASNPGLAAGTQAPVNPADLLTAALLVKSGLMAVAEKEFGDQVLQTSQRYHGAPLMQVCELALRLEGKPIPSNRDSMLRAAISTQSLPVALGNTANKAAAAAYQIAPSPWRSFATVKSAANFKSHTGVRATFLGGLQEIPPGGDVQHGTIAEETFSWRISSYGKLVSIDRRDFIDDDASVFSDTIPALGRAAARGLNNLVTETILGNSGSFFAAGHSNYFEGAATNLQASSLSTAVQTLRMQKDAEGSVLGLEPRVLLVPAQLETTARELLVSRDLDRYTASGTDRAPRGNIFVNLADLVVDPRLGDSSFAGYSAVSWYLLAGAETGCIVVGFLGGNESPTVESWMPSDDPSKLAFTFRVFHDYGCALGDYRAGVKSKGSA